MRLYRLWRCRNLSSGGATHVFTYESALEHLEAASAKASQEFDWGPVDPYSLDVAWQFEGLGWLVRGPWKNLLTVDDTD